MKILVVLILALGTLTQSGCGFMVSEGTVVRAAQKQGYEDVRIQSRHWISPVWVGGCSGSDDVAFDATALNPRGVRVDIVLCAGWPFKGVTVRTE